MPFDGKNPNAEALEKVAILIGLCSQNMDQSQRSFESCMWFEAVHDTRLRELGICELMGSGVAANDGPISYATAARFFLGSAEICLETLGVGAMGGWQWVDPTQHPDSVIGREIFGAQSKMTKRAFLMRLRDQLEG